MTSFKSAEEILEFAIGEEEAAAALYAEMANKATDPRMREVWESFAREEEEHKRKLENVKIEYQADFPAERIAEMSRGEFEVEGNPDPDMDYEQALQLVMQMEVAAFKLYTRLAALAAAAENQKLRELFLALAQEEANHKLHFEVEYDEVAGSS